MATRLFQKSRGALLSRPNLLSRLDLLFLPVYLCTTKTISAKGMPIKFFFGQIRPRKTRCTKLTPFSNYSFSFGSVAFGQKKGKWKNSDFNQLIALIISPTFLGWKMNEESFKCSCDDPWQIKQNEIYTARRHRDIQEQPSFLFL